MPKLLLLQRVSNYRIHTQLRLWHTSCLGYRSIHHWWFSGKVVDFSHHSGVCSPAEAPVIVSSNHGDNEMKSMRFFLPLLALAITLSLAVRAKAQTLTTLASFTLSIPTVVRLDDRRVPVVN